MAAPAEAVKEEAAEAAPAKEEKDPEQAIMDQVLEEVKADGEKEEAAASEKRERALTEARKHDMQVTVSAKDAEDALAAAFDELESSK